MSMRIPTMSILLLLATSYLGDAQSVKQVEKWFRRIPHKTEKFTHLHFYFHLVLLSGNNSNTYQIVRPPLGRPNSNFSTEFGFMNMADNPITNRPSPESRELGRAQGFYARDDLRATSFIMGYTFVFTAPGFRNGSSLSVFSRNAVLETRYREVAIVGGTGVFRLAKGVAVLRTLTLDPFATVQTVECDVFVVHY